MSERFSFNFNSSKFSKIFNPMLVSLYLLNVALVSVSKFICSGNHSYFVFTIVSYAFILMTTYGLIMFLIAPFLFSSLSYKNVSFQMAESIPKYTSAGILGTVLSIISGFLYMPFHLHKLSCLLFGNITYKGIAFEFKGKLTKLYRILFIYFYLPMALLILSAAYLYIKYRSILPNDFICVLLFVSIMFLLIIPYYIQLFRWFANGIYYKDFSVQYWNISFIRTILTFYHQIFISIISLYILWPISMLKLDEYLLNKTEIRKGVSIIGRFVFDWKKKGGFQLYWKHAFFVIISFGFYLPWSIKYVGQWLIGNMRLIKGNEIDSKND